MVYVNAQRLEAALNALGEQLALVGASAHLVVIGGSGLLAIGAVTRSTQDVDVVALAHHGRLVSAEPLPMPVVEAAALVARDLDLDPTWLNPGPTSLLDLGLPDGFADRLGSRDYGRALRVSFASRLDQIHLKLYAAADRRAPRDFADLRQLAPTADELRAGARWARTHNMPGPFDDALADALAKFGVQDDGRDA
ncbi:MAG TPA: DUF6036 family nucleotidyltransferase [Solirubrobacteraceae bacterium]|nr:DUF6036 family nucleotidyltransferase [Solirubrobacteraceae bacterium]